MISWDRVHELRDEVGEEDFAEVVSLFLEEVDEVMCRLQADPDPSTYEADLHFLKGSALNLGFHALSTMCRDKEIRIAASTASEVDLDDIFGVYEQSKAEFLSTGVSAHSA
jgi:HPt (histidine-containing phosphotransfer) domain-containing protein